MGAHIMERSLLLYCLVALVIPANSMKCHMCIGEDEGCSTTEVTCPGESDQCSTSAMHIDSFPCATQKIFKGCINSTSPSKTLSVSPSELVTLSLQQEMCDSDLCNTHEISEPDSNLNDLYCYACISPGIGCNSAKMSQLRCKGGQNLCVDMKVIGSFGSIADVNMKGCGQIPSCTQDLVFSSQTSSVSVQCCNENYCNSDTDYKSEDKTPNGIQCYSCNTLDGTSCSPEEVVKAQCYGTLTSCLEVAGISMKGGQPMPTIIKGCATPSMCDSSVLPLLQKLGSATVKCCNGSLCNNQYSESALKTSGYFPIRKSSAETGIKNTHSGGPSRNHKYYDSSVKTGHHGTKYGTGSMSPSSTSYNSNCNDVNIFSAVNSPNMSPGNNNDEGVKGGSWNSNSHGGYPNLSAENNISSSGNNTAGSGNTSSAGSTGIFPENASHNISSPINNSSGKDNLSVLSPGGPALGGESVSVTPNYNSNDNSNLGVPTSFPDFTNYDSNIFPNSYNDNMNYPNNEDFSSYEGASFTDVVYSDIDSNENRSSSPTVTPNSIITNSNNSTGNSGSHNNTYNPNGILSANSETSGHSVNNGSNVNRQENIGTILNLISTTPKTHNFNFNQPISEYSTSIDNMGIASNNVSENNTGNNSSTGTVGIFPGSESHNISVSDNSNYSNSNSSPIPDVTPTFADFTSYVDNIFPNSYSENNMNNPSNSFNSYESTGVTEVVYVDIDLNDDQSNSSTVAPDISNNSDSNSGSDNNSYNQDIILPANNNQTSGYPADTVNIGSNINASGNNGSIQNLTSIIQKTQNYNINQQISGYGTNIYNAGNAYSNCSGNNTSSSGNNTAGSGNTSSAGSAGTFSKSESHNISSPINNSSGEDDLNTLSCGGSVLGGESVSDTSDYNNDDNSIPNKPPTFPDAPSYVDSNIVTSSYDNNMNYPNNNDFNGYESAGFTDIVLSDIDRVDGQPNSPTVAPNSIVTNSYGSVGNNDFGSYESAGFTDIVLPDIDENDDQTSSSTVAPNSIVYNSYNAVGNSGSNNSAYNPNVNLSANNETSDLTTVNMVNVQGSNPGIQHLTPATSKTHNSGIKQQISGYGNNVHNTGVANNNGSGNYISSSGNNTAGSGNTYSTGTSSYSGYNNMPGGSESSTTYISPGNGTGMTNGWNNENNSSNHNIVVPLGYGNIPGSNHSSPSYGSSGNGTSVTNEWINSNDSSHNMAIPLGYNNVPGNNHSSMIYTGNGTGMSNEWNNSNDSMATPVGYNNMAGNNHSSTSYTGDGSGMSNEWNNSNDSSHNMATPVGYNNIAGNNHSSTSYTGDATGISNEWNNSSSINPNMSVLGGYAKISESNDSSTSYTNGSNGSSTSYTSSGNGTRTTSDQINSNDSSHNMATPVGYNNMPGYSNSSTSYTGNGGGITNTWINSNDSSHNMATPVGYNNMPGNSNSSTSDTGNGGGITNTWINGNDSSHNMATPVGYNNVPENNHSSTSYSVNGTSMSNEWSNGNSFNSNMSVPGGHANIPGSNDSSTSYTSSGNENGVTNEWINNNSSYPNMAAPGGHYGSFNSNDSNYMLNSNFSSIEDYLNHMFPGENNYGPNFNASSELGDLVPKSNSNETAYTYGHNYEPNMVPNNNSNGSSSNHNDIQKFFSTVNGYIHDGGKNITELIQNNSFISSLMPPGMNVNGSGPSGYNINSIVNGSLSDYFKSLGNSWNNSINNITSMFSGGNNGPFNISNFGGGLSNIMFNPNLMNPHENHGGSSYGSNNGGTGLNGQPNSNTNNDGSINNYNSYAMPPVGSNSYGSSNNNGYYGNAGDNGQANSNTNDMSSGGYHVGSIDVNGHNSYAVPPGGNNNGANNSGSSYGAANVDGNNYNINLMDHGLNGSMLANGSNSQSIWPNSYIQNEFIPGRSTNDSAGGGAGNSTGGGGFMFNGAPSLWTKSESFVIFSAIALLVLN